MKKYKNKICHKNAISYLINGRPHINGLNILSILTSFYLYFYGTLPSKPFTHSSQNISSMKSR